MTPLDPYAASLDLWWAIPGVLAGMPMPLIHPERRKNLGGALDAYSDDLPALAKAGIQSVVCLLNIPGDSAVYSSAGFGFHYLPIPDGFPPTTEQFKGFLGFMKEQRSQNRAVAVHCAAGIGRTGVVIAGYLMTQGATFEEAVVQVRAVRPGAIETQRQLTFLYELSGAA